MLRTYLPSVIANTTLPGCEIIVADNGSTDNSLEVLQKEFPSVRIIALDQNYGFAEGYNRALAQTNAEYTVLLNSDVETPEGWLAPLLDYLNTHPDTAAVQPKIRSWRTKTSNIRRLMHDTVKQFDQVTAHCRTIFIDKMQDYGPSWRIFRLHGITDQLYIKVCNIRQRQETGVSLVGDDIEGNLRAIVNYGITAIIQARHGYADSIDMSREQALELYDTVLNEAKELMVRKNHDYGEAWREMSKEGIIDMILAKIIVRLFHQP